MEDATRLKLNLERECEEVYCTSKDGLGPAYLHAWRDIERIGAYGSRYVVHVDVGHGRDAWGPVIGATKFPAADIIIGSRFVKGGSHHGNWQRKQTSRLAAAACSMVTGTQIKDWTSGLRAYSPKARAVLSEYPFTTTGHAWQIEALWAALAEGLVVKEVPIVYRAGNSSLSRARVQEAAVLWRRMCRQPLW